MLLCYHFRIRCITIHPKDQLNHFSSTILTSDHTKIASPICQVQQRRCVYYDLHNELVSYKEAWDWQRSVLESRKELVRKDEDFEDMVMVLQHKPVYTLGTGSSEEFMKFDMNNAPYDLYKTERGGDVTYHGPGQLVMYPIMNLRYHKMDLHWYLRALEEVKNESGWRIS